MHATGRLLFLLLLTAACDSDIRSSDAQGTASVIRNQREQGWTAERGWRLTLTGRIGAGDAEGEDAFGRLVDVTIDPLGRVWVADEIQQRLKIFEWDGTFVRSVGRKGGGPGEFQGIAGFDWAPDGSLWVLDGGNARFAVYDTAGRFIASHPRTSSVTETPWPGGFDRRGYLADSGNRREVGGESVASLVRFSPDRRSVDTLRLAPLKNQFFGALRSGDAHTQRIKQAPVPFTGTQIWAMDPEGYAWVAVTDQYRLERRGFDGTVERVVELRNTPRRVTRADKDQILKNYRWFEQAGGKIDPSRIPDHHPHLHNFFFDDHSHVWVLPTYFRGERPQMDVFSPDGRFLGQVQAPVPFLSRPTPAVRGEWVAAIARDDDGVDSVVLMRLEKPGG